MSAVKRDIICRVCGDKAFGLNFCAFTCESCKAFFRRNASRPEKLRCGNDDQCEITIESRRRCSKCRLKKCYQVGMKKEWILTEHQRRERNEKIEENRKRRLQKNKSTEKNKSSSESNTSSCDNILQWLFRASCRDNPKDISTKEGSDTPEDSSSSQSSQESCPESIQSLVRRCGHTTAEVVPLSRPIIDYSNSFNEIESNRLTELIEASKYLTVIVSDITSKVTTISEAMKIVSLRWDQEIRKIIKTAKTLSAFKSICEKDKITLLKYSCPRIQFMRSVNNYDNKAECWYVCLESNNNDTCLLNLDIFKQISMERYSRYKVFLSRLSDEWNMDHLILHLLFTILLFNPNRPQLIHQNTIKLQQQIYMHLFKRYLQLKYKCEREANERFDRFMNILSDLHDIHDQHIRPSMGRTSEESTVFLETSPLLKEIYDS